MRTVSTALKKRALKKRTHLVKCYGKKLASRLSEGWRAV
jgi:hypothetical protein